MKLHAAISESEIDVEIRREADNVFARVGDDDYQIEVHQMGNGSYLMVLEGKVFECRIEGQPESGKSVDVFVGASHFVVALTDPKRLRGSSGAATHHDEARIVAPMPGKVVRILVDVGTEIEAGAGVVVVEAMKMQNEMKSPRAGTVASLNVQIGATVNGGDVLAVIE